MMKGALVIAVMLLGMAVAGWRLPVGADRRLSAPAAAADEGRRLFGFDVSRHGIPLDAIESGGPGRDGIPALRAPVFLPAAKTTFLTDSDRVLGLAIGGQAKAYPIRILNWHEVVNDEIAGRPVLVTYCPLCGTGIAFDPMVAGRRHTFGVSGLLYNSDLLLYDDQTESLWAQVLGTAVTGPMTGSRLTLLPLVHTTWGRWRAEHPDTLVLSTKTGYIRDYRRDPYDGYDKSARVWFTLTTQDARFHPKEWVLGLEVLGGGKPVRKAYPFSVLSGLPRPLLDTVNGQRIKVVFDRDSRTAWATDAQGHPLPSVTGFWFAWYAFYPNTQVFDHAPGPSRGSAASKKENRP